MNVQSFCWNVLEIFFENQRELQAQFEKSKQIELHERFTFRRMIRCNDSTLRRITSYETARGNLLVYSLRTLYFSRGARGKYAYLREFFFLIFFFLFLLAVTSPTLLFHESERSRDWTYPPRYFCDRRVPLSRRYRDKVLTFSNVRKLYIEFRVDHFEDCLRLAVLRETATSGKLWKFLEISEGWNWWTRLTTKILSTRDKLLTNGDPTKKTQKRAFIGFTIIPSSLVWMLVHSVA